MIDRYLKKILLNKIDASKKILLQSITTLTMTVRIIIQMVHMTTLLISLSENEETNKAENRCD